MVESLGHRASTPSARTWTRKRQTITSTTKPDPDPHGPHGPHVPLAEVLESAPDAVVGIGLDGLIVFANQQVEALFGYPPGDLIGRPMELLLPERFREAHRQHRGHYFSSPVRRPMGAGLQLAALRRDGSEFPVDVALAPFDTGSGLLVSAAVRDITERKQEERAAQHLREA
jgi:PAS domain S-box-containing protein